MKHYVTYKEIITLFQEYVEQSPVLNTFGWGNLVDFGKNTSGTSVNYPYMFVTPQSITYDENTTTYSLAIMFTDILDTTVYNDVDIVSQMSLEARRFLSYIKRGMNQNPNLYNSMDIQMGVSSLPFMERMSDHVGGVQITANIIVFEDINACDYYEEIVPTPTNTPSPTPTQTSTQTPTPSPTPTETSTQTPTPTPTPTITPTGSGTPTPTPSGTPTPTPTNPNLFEVGLGFDANVNVVYLDQSSNSLFVGGRFSFWNGTPTQALVKMNTNGTIDPTFVNGLVLPNATNITSIIGSENPNEIYIAGDFTNYPISLISQRIVRINKNTGALVTGWSGTNAQNTVSNMVLDGNKVVIVGAFINYKGTTRNRIARVNSNNTLDTTIFTGTSFNSAPLGIIKNNNGNYVCIGGATTYDGGNIGRIVELNSTTGNNVGTFGTGFGSTTVNDVVQDPVTGYYYVVGNTNSSYQGGPTSWIHVIDSTGTLVTSTPPFVSTTNCFNISADWTNDALYVAFGNPNNFRKIILSTYTEDTTWKTNLGVVNNTSSTNACEFTTTDQYGRQYIVGSFTSFFGQNFNRIVRLNPNGTNNSSN